MNSSLDLNLLLLARLGGKTHDDLPDLYAATPPRRAARGREADSLIIYFSMAGNSPLSPEAHTQLLEKLAGKFFESSGSVTSALRSVAEALNLYLLERNLHSTSIGRQGVGQLILAALRADTLYLAQCGTVHAFRITPKEIQHLHDPQSSGRGLGLSRTTPVRFLQVKMEPDDFLVLATATAPNWSEAQLKYPQRQGIDGIRRQLMDNDSPNFNSVIVQAQPGTGKLHVLRRKAEAPVMAHPSAEAPAVESGNLPAAMETAGQPTEDRKLGIPPAVAVEKQFIEMEKPKPSNEQPPIEQPRGEVARGEVSRGEAVPMQTASQPLAASSVSLPTEDVTQVSSASPANFVSADSPVYPTASGTRPIQSTTPLGETVTSTTAQVPPRAVPQASTPTPASKKPSTLRVTLAAMGATILRAFRSALTTLGNALLRLLKSLLPDADIVRLPPSAMIFIALAIPLILATIGGVVFIQRGRAQQGQIYYQQAVEEAAHATSLTDPLQQRMAWLTVIAKLDKAEYYVVTSQSQDLRLQATQNLDNLDAIKRLDYKQAIVGGLESGVKITSMVATPTDLYMLNGENSSVLHAIMTGRGYEIDPNFQCGPTYGPINVESLVDIAELPPGGFENASVLALDPNGNLLYCVVGSQPYSASLAPPNTGLGKPIAITIDRGDLYVLDPTVNAVWIYRNMEVTQPPHLYFGDFVPPMADVIDLAVYNDDLFLLHADGHITKCIYSGLPESPTRCDDPYPFSDNRLGRQHGPIIEGTAFSQIYYSSFPERSIYTLDPSHQAIYYFSVLLNLQCQYLPKEAIADGPATAFAISPNRTAFLAIGNYVYYAAMP